MKRGWYTKFSPAQWLLVMVPVLAVLVPVLVFAQYMFQRHADLARQLEEVVPRYARLLALEQQKDELAETLQQVLQTQERVLYSGQGDAAQIGNNVQNRLRGALVKAGLSISSSQVKVEKANSEDAEESIEVHMTAEGTIGQIQLGMIALEEMYPRVWLAQIQISHRGSLINANTQIDPTLSVRMVFSIPRSKDSA